jgi:5-methylcytosine-specific restriction endonuclease McrA
MVAESSAVFDTAHNDAFRALGALAPGQQWSAFDVTRDEARARRATLFVTTVWNFHSFRDETGKRVRQGNGILQDRFDGTLWYRMGRPAEKPRKTWVSHWTGLQLAFEQGLPVVGVLKDVDTGRCSLNSLFDCPTMLYEADERAIWLQLVPRGEVGCDVGVADVRAATGGQAAQILDAGRVAAEFQAAVAVATQSSEVQRLARLAMAPKKPRRLAVTSSVFARNPDVVAQVLFRAAGECERCGKRAPFIRRADGTPYLEVHHRVQLAAGGDDTVENAIAVCPNCHREAHFGVNPGVEAA